jgi:hypothetical protein
MDATGSNVRLAYRRSKGVWIVFDLDFARGSASRRTAKSRAEANQRLAVSSTFSHHGSIPKEVFSDRFADYEDLSMDNFHK